MADDDFDDDFDMEPVVPRGRKTKTKKKGGALKVGLVVLVVLLILIGVVAGGAWYFWLSEWYGSPADGEVPVVRADSTPIKVRPKDPGGMAVPDRDKLVYKRMNGESAPPSGMERLLPPAEEPAPVPAVPRPNAMAEAPQPAQAPAQPMAAAEAPAAPLPPAATQPPPAAQPAPQVAAAPTPPPIPNTPTSPVKDGAPVSLAPKPLQTSPAPAAEPTRPKTQAPVSAAKSTAPAATRGAAPSAASANAYRIQLGAVRSDAAARKEWQRLKTRHKDVLGGLALSVVRADLGAKGVYYRLRAGPFADRDRAAAACGKLKADKVPCFPVAPGK